MTTTKTAAELYTSLQTALAPYADRVEFSYEEKGIYIEWLIKGDRDYHYTELDRPVRLALRDIGHSITLDEAKVLNANPKDASDFFIISTTGIIDWDELD